MILRIHICTTSQELLYAFSITTENRNMNRSMFATVFSEEVGGFDFLVIDGQI